MDKPATYEIGLLDQEDMHDFAARVAGAVRPGDLILLRGTLGAGKSFFARALIRTLCGAPDMEVPSPTFTLVQPYDTPQGPLAHFDLYRLEDPEEVFELGWEDALAEGITVAEWPERLEGLVLPPALRLEFSFVDGRDDVRRVMATLQGDWAARLNLLTSGKP